MVFSSIIFLLYFLPLFLWVYLLVPKSLKNAVILIGSCLFYAWESPQFVFVILTTTWLDYHFVRQMDKVESPFLRKIWLVFSLSLNLGLLFYFKYCNFFVENLSEMLSEGSGTVTPWIKLALPIGISFYTFESITYVVDVYRKIHKPLRNFWLYQVYIMLFPKLIAGPVIRYHEISEQLTNRIETAELRLYGLYRFIIGLSKKVWIANTMAGYAADIYSHSPDKISTLGAWTGALAYTFQIYFDFSGYSDMAIGIGKMMGFRFPENFNNPYSSLSITEFWKRWHITLGAWMRNYLYIPLGGNQVTPPYRIYVNLMVVFLISGFWHGAEWAFVFWGLYHGFFLIVERLFLLKILQNLPKFVGLFYAFLVVVIGLVFFNLEEIPKSIAFLKIMFGEGKPDAYQSTMDFMFLFYFTLAFLFSFWILLPKGKAIQEVVFSEKYGFKEHVFASFLSFIFLILCAAKITGSDFNPFIYFRF
ncbi:MAG: MBOAT family protein [Bacteroidia bacterium]|nr:MBOAT family protein [Bacteroidia bacterium]